MITMVLVLEKTRFAFLFIFCIKKGGKKTVINRKRCKKIGFNTKVFGIPPYLVHKSREYLK